ncbi:amidohydrolase family protein [Granulicella arctica]|uniref:Tol biopolymer transport system component n=1 Tax=Granulicella arctica TaxID=940613 RepID=A0A7Y9TH66_9BACT|nr:amidohydrolase family protein [Granulicella arctica]NYF80244.1 Tol biopolymer transport system component [Granulicella arctica]
MHFVSPRLSALALMIAASSAFAATPITKTIAVSEGTDMAVTVSPNHKTILMDVQGLLFTMPFAGGASKQITTPEQEASHPDWSPNGNFVAIQSYAGGTFHIWTMHPDGTDLKQITNGHGDDREPRISPDSKTIAFASDRSFKGSYDIWTVDVASGVLKQITSSEADEFEPAWSPDGSSLAFVSGSSITGKSIEAINLASGHQHTVASIDSTIGRLEAPSFSPDGAQIAYVRFSGVGLFMNTASLIVANASGDSAPTYIGKATDAFPFPATWLSKTELIYTGNGHILHTNLSAKTESSIPFTAVIESTRPQYAHKVYDFDSTAAHPVKGIYAPALSPDGKQAAFVALNQLYLMTIGSAPVALTHDTFYKQGPAWSPDGKRLAYVSDRDGIENIYLHDLAALDDSADRRVSPSQSAQIMPAWSPDGRLIAFQDQTGATLLTDVTTGAVKSLAPLTFFPGRPSFSTNGKTVAIATIKPYTKRFREGTSSILTVDVATGKTEFFSPAKFESITTRTEDGPIYAPNGKEIAFVMDDLLYTMPVDADGHPSGPASKLNDETTDAPTWSGDSRKILYLNNGTLKLLDVSSKVITLVPVELTFTRSKPEQKLLIHAARFWKGSGPGEQMDVDILITDNRVTSVTPHSATPPPGITRTIEAGDSTVMPGMWENHAHTDSDNSIYYGSRMGRLWLSYGVTEIRAIADNAYRALEHRESYDSGTAIGPRLFTTGEAVDGERVYYPMMIPTTSEAQLHREFDRLKALDFDFIKLYVRLPYSWAEQGIQYAHTRMGVETASHYLLPAVSLGEDGMSHVSATARTGWAYSRSLTGSSYSDVSKLLSQSGMWTISTTFSQSLYAEDPGMATDPRQAIAPPWENARLKVSVSGATKTDQTSALQHLKEEESVVSGVIRDGGLLLAGTDSPLDLPATSLHLNLRAQVKYGLAPWQALETVTVLPAKAYGLTKDLGTLDPGHLADLIIVSGDPLKNIDDAARVQCVMKNGQLQSVGVIMAPFAKSNIGNNICP